MHVLLPHNTTMCTVKRLSGSEPKGDAEVMSATSIAISNLRTKFAVVGVLERYNLFIDLVRVACVWGQNVLD